MVTQPPEISTESSDESPVETPEEPAGPPEPTDPGVVAARRVFEAGDVRRARAMARAIDRHALAEPDRKALRVLERGIRRDPAPWVVAAVMASVWLYLVVTYALL